MIMIKSAPFKIAFIVTALLCIMTYAFLLVDFNTQQYSFKGCPSLFKVENKNNNSYDIEFLGNKYTLDTKIDHQNEKYLPIINAMIPKKAKLIETMICYGYATYVTIDQYIRTLEYEDNIKDCSYK